MMAPIQEAPAESLVGVELRRATPADRDTLIEMYNSFEPKAASLGLPPQRNPERWLDGLGIFPNFLALVQSRVVGHSVLCTDGDTAEIAVFVHQDYRGRGLGKKLLSAMMEEARRRGLRRVWGVTEPDNVPMLRLARSLGFVSGQEPGEFHLELRTPATVSPEHVSAT